MNRIGVVCALTAEARCLTRTPDPAIQLTITGTGATAAHQGAQELLSAGVDALVSWGTAGGLDPQLSAGTLLVPETIVSQGECYIPCPQWRRRLLQCLQPIQAEQGPLLHTRTALSNPADKIRAPEHHHAVACDMESGAIAAAATQARLPCIVIRAIADPAHLRVPLWTLQATAAGTLHKAALSALLHPLDWPALYRLSGAFRAALRTLSQAAPCLRNSLRQT